MRAVPLSLTLLLGLFTPAVAQRGNAPAANDTIRTLVARLDLEKYKATIKGLTQFGDRRQGTERNRAAIDWIEAQLKSYGCTNTERLNYVYSPPPPPPPAAPAPVPPRNPVIPSGEVRPGQGGSRLRGIAQPTTVNDDPMAQP